MSLFETMMENNAAFAAAEAQAGTLMPSLPAQLPHVKALVIGCADMRVDPERILGMAPGQAVVIRNIGGRVTPGLLLQLGLLGRIGEVAEAVPGGGGEFNLVVLHHTDCGMKRLAGDPDKIAAYFNIAKEAVAAKSPADPRTAVATDVEALRGTPGLPPQWLLSGLVYDVATGRVEVVVPPHPIRGV